MFYKFFYLYFGLLCSGAFKQPTSASTSQFPPFSSRASFKAHPRWLMDMEFGQSLTIFRIP